MKENKNYPTATLCDTRMICDYAEYVEWCEDMEREPQDEDSRDYWNFVYEEQVREYDDLMGNLNFSKYKDTPCVIVGKLGLWDGTHEIVAVYQSHIADAITKCVGSCDDVKVEIENGHINVYGYHHDGTNCFEIHKLSKKGIDMFDKHPYDDVNIKPYMLAKFKGWLY